MQKRIVYLSLICFLGLVVYYHGSNYTRQALKNRIQFTESDVVESIPVYNPENLSENFAAISQTTAKTPSPPADDEFALGSAMWFTFQIISIVLTLFGGLCSGLTVGMLGVEQQDLEVEYKKYKNSKDPENKKKSDDAMKLLKLLKDHHLLLATLLLSNAAAMEALPLFLDDLVPSWLAIILSISVVLIFGEILPQAVCTGENQVRIACKMIPVVKCLIFVLYPICKPIGWLLDKVLGLHQKKRYQTDNLRELIKLHSIVKKPVESLQGQDAENENLKTSDNEKVHPDHDEKKANSKLFEQARKRSNECGRKDSDEDGSGHNHGGFNDDEIGILLSTFDLRHDTVTDPEVIIPVKNIFWASEDQAVDKEFIKRLKAKNCTRFPIRHAGNEHRFMGIIGVKTLIKISMHDSPQTFKQYFENNHLTFNKIKYVSKDTTLITALRVFQMYKTSLIMVVDYTKNEYLKNLDKKKTWSKKLEANLTTLQAKKDITQDQIDLHRQLYMETKEHIIRPKDFDKLHTEGTILGMIHIKDIFEKLCGIGEFEDDGNGVSMLANFMMSSVNKKNPKKTEKQYGLKRASTLG